MRKTFFSLGFILVSTFSSKAFSQIILNKSIVEIEPTASEAIADIGISSGGGFIMGDASNPWFLENTKFVNYCIDLDSNSFHAAPEIVRKSIQGAFQAWKLAFRKSDEIKAGPWGDASELLPRLATQSFREIESCEQADIRFQMGKLTPEQSKVITKPQNVIGTAFRTHYAKETLKAKGFVYIAADTGPLRPLVPNSIGFNEKAWTDCDGCILQAVLTHEIGHIFGLQHSSDLENSLMASYYAQFVTAKEFWSPKEDRLLPSTLIDQSVHIKALGFDRTQDIVFCDNGGSMITFFTKSAGIESSGCLRFKHRTNEGGSIEISFQNDSSSDDTVIASIKRSINSVDNNFDALANIYLPAGQKVFANVPKTTSFLQSASRLLKQSSTQKITFMNGLSKSVQINLLPNNVLAMSFVDEDGKFTNFEYQSSDYRFSRNVAKRVGKTKVVTTAR